MHKPFPSFAIEYSMQRLDQSITSCAIQHSRPAQPSTAQHSTAQHSTAQHNQHNRCCCLTPTVKQCTAWARLYQLVLYFTIRLPHGQQADDGSKHRTCTTMLNIPDPANAEYMKYTRECIADHAQPQVINDAHFLIHFTSHNSNTWLSILLCFKQTSEGSVPSQGLNNSAGRVPATHQCISKPLVQTVTSLINNRSV